MQQENRTDDIASGSHHNNSFFNNGKQNSNDVFTYSFIQRSSNARRALADGNPSSRENLAVMRWPSVRLSVRTYAFHDCVTPRNQVNKITALENRLAIFFYFSFFLDRDKHFGDPNKKNMLKKLESQKCTSQSCVCYVCNVCSMRL